MSEWFQRYGAAEVHPRLIIGAVPLDANDVQTVAEQQVDRVLNLVQDEEYPDGARLEVEIALAANQIVERRVQVVDFGNLSTPALEQAVRQVVAWLGEGEGEGEGDGEGRGRRVYLHCRAGWQRSATVAAGVIALREDVDLEEALGRLRARKPTADPLPHQRDDLRLWWESRDATAGGGPEPDAVRGPDAPG